MTDLKIHRSKKVWKIHIFFSNSKTNKGMILELNGNIRENA